MKVLAIGDVHTKTWIIEYVKSFIDDYDAIVFVGDYADDWNASPAMSIYTWRLLYELSLSDTKVKILTGNHDYIYAHKTPTKQSGYSYVTQTLIDAPENKQLKRWLGNLPITLEIDDVTYSHAGVDANWNTSTDPNFLWSDDSPIWNRPGHTVYGPEAQVFGHTPSKTCWEVEENVWCIDTHSTFHNGENIGDNSLLEIIDGEKFNIKKLEKNENNNNTSSIKDSIPR